MPMIIGADDGNRTRLVFVGNEVLHLEEASAFLDSVLAVFLIFLQELFRFSFWSLYSDSNRGFFFTKEVFFL